MTYPISAHGEPFASPKQLQEAIDKGKEQVSNLLTLALRRQLNLPLADNVWVGYLVTNVPAMPATHGTCFLTVAMTSPTDEQLRLDTHWERPFVVQLRSSTTAGCIELVDEELHSAIERLRAAALARWHVYQYYIWQDKANEAQEIGDADARDRAASVARHHMQAAARCGALSGGGS